MYSRLTVCGEKAQQLKIMFTSLYLEKVAISIMSLNFPVSHTFYKQDSRRRFGNSHFRTRGKKSNLEHSSFCFLLSLGLRHFSFLSKGLLKSD